MVRNETVINATPEAVFDVLADGRSYGYWVVGSGEIREVEDGFPAIGTAFHHKVGWGPFKVADETRIEACERPHRLKLRAKARPLGTAVVELELYPHPQGTRVVMTEDAGDRLTSLVFTPLTHFAVRARNVESLRRLARLAEDRQSSMSRAAA